MYLRSSNSLHSILANVSYKKNEATWTQIPCFGVALDSSGTTGMVQPITHNLVRRKQDGSDHTTWYTSATSVGPRGMAQPIAVAMT